MATSSTRSAESERLGAWLEVPVRGIDQHERGLDSSRDSRPDPHE